MNTCIDILIADKNPHIRDFLRREFHAAGYSVDVADNCRQLLNMIDGPHSPVLLIIDPDLPDADFVDLAEILRDRVPPLRIVLHSLEPEQRGRRWPIHRSCWVEKNGCSIENLKRTVAGMLPAGRRPAHG